jgi:hypothetical protein
MSKSLIKELIVLFCLIPNFVFSLNTGNAWVLCYGDNGHIAIETEHEETSTLAESACDIHEFPSQEKIAHDICHDKQSCHDVLIADGRTQLESYVSSTGLSVVYSPGITHEVIDSDNAELSLIRLKSIPLHGPRAILAQLTSVILII